MWGLNEISFIKHLVQRLLIVNTVSVSNSGGGDDDDDDGEDNDNMVAAAALDSLSSASIKYHLMKS